MTLNSSSVAPSPASSTSSSTASVGSSSTVVNASRLRENQRRSRARKKEYLLSLEARFQACQRTGIEANIDIQVAAKKVVRENLILRGMLKMRGVTDGEIDKTLKDGGEGCVNGETAVQGVLKVLGKRPCSGGPTVGGTGMQCKPTGAPPRATATERRNSTGMVAARETDRGGGRGAVTGLAAVSTSKHPLLSLSPQQRHTPFNYPTPSPTPTAAPTSNYALALSSAHMNSFYGYGGMSSSPAYASSPVSNSPSTYASPKICNSPPKYTPTICNSPPTYASPTICDSSPAYASPTICDSSPTYASPTSPPTYNSYQMTSSISNPCSFYPTAQQCTPSVSSSCCPQRPMYSTSMSSSPSCSYQTPTTTTTTTTPISSTTSCQLAQSFINQLHPGLPGENASHLIDSICPPDMMQDGQCHVDNAVLFAVLDRI